MIEASTARINRHHLGLRNLRSDAFHFNCDLLFRSISYSRSRSLPRLSVTMQFQGSNMGTPSEARTSLRHKEDKQSQFLEGVTKSYATEEQAGGSLRTDEPVPVESVVPQKKTAKIHDFCFGIPYGGLVFSGGLVGFLLSRNPASLTNGVLYGGALLALSFLSLKIWRKGKSSLPFILGQAAISVVLLRKHFHAYGLTKKIFPSGFYFVVSTAMLCFYSYVVASGGNPLPKKLKLAASSPGTATDK